MGDFPKRFLSEVRVQRPTHGRNRSSMGLYLAGLPAFQGTEGEIMSRLDGCVQRLRNVLMCEGDATPYLIMLTPEKKEKESPDFNTLHYCKNFDGVLNWARENEVQETVATPPLYSFTYA
ncbi:hypothetical protein LA080_005801 [Diaporthe eres]|nr:hypothetical protein LA080_005801 [Diaporthe eres]